MTVDRISRHGLRATALAALLATAAASAPDDFGCYQRTAGRAPQAAPAPEPAAELAQADDRRYSRFVVENRGTACFMGGDSPGGAIIEFRPHAGCLSSSCTRRFEETLTAAVRQVGGVATIVLESRFVLGKVLDPVVCTADCGGGGRATAVLGALAPGRYPVTLGGTPIGTLDTGDLKPGFDNPVCLDSGP